MKTKFLFPSLCVVFLSMQSGNAQIAQFPVVQPMKYKNFELGPFVPSKEFLAKNPNFMKDGSFQLDPSLIRHFFSTRVQNDLAQQYERTLLHQLNENYEISTKEYNRQLDSLDNNKISLSQESIESLYKISSSNFSAVAAESNDSINLGSHFFYSGLNAFTGLKDYLEVYTQTYQLLKKYILNYSYSASPAILFPGGKIDFSYDWKFRDSNIIQPEDIILRLTAGDIVEVPNDKSQNNFPSYVLFKLSVQNIFGVVLNSYSQGIFFTCNNFSGDNIYRTPAFEGEVLGNVALKSLLAQFANDSSFKTFLSKYQDSQANLKKNNPYYTEYVKNKLLFQDLEYFEKIYIDEIHEINEDLNKHGVENLYKIEKLNGSSGKIVEDAAANILLNAFGVIGNMISEANNKREVESDKKDGNDLITQLKILQAKKDSIANVLSPLVKAKLIEENIISNNNVPAAGEMANTLSQSYNAAKNNLNNPQFNKGSMASAFNSTANGTGSIAQALTADGSTNNNMFTDEDLCSQQAQAEWKSTANYKACQLGTSQAVCDDAKADLGELMLRYCSDKLDPANRIAIQAGINTARSTAATLRQVNVFKWDINFTPPGAVNKKIEPGQVHIRDANLWNKQ